MLVFGRIRGYQGCIKTRKTKFKWYCLLFEIFLRKSLKAICSNNWTEKNVFKHKYKIQFVATAPQLYLMLCWLWKDQKGKTTRTYMYFADIVWTFYCCSIIHFFWRPRLTQTHFVVALFRLCVSPHSCGYAKTNTCTLL